VLVECREKINLMSVDEYDEEEQTEEETAKTKASKPALQEILNGDGGEDEEGSEMSTDTFSTPVARVRSLKDNRNAIFVATVTRQSEEDWDTLFEKERQRELLLREQFAEQRRIEEEAEKKANLELEKKQLPLIDHSKIPVGGMAEVVREIMKLVDEGEKLTDAVADAHTANNNRAYSLAAHEIVRRASLLHVTALIAAASDAEKLGNSLQQSGTQDPSLLEGRVDHIINIANQIDRLQSFFSKQKTSQPSSSYSSSSSSSTATPPTSSSSTNSTKP